MQYIYILLLLYLCTVFSTFFNFVHKEQLPVDKLTRTSTKIVCKVIFVTLYYSLKWRRMPSCCCFNQRQVRLDGLGCCCRHWQFLACLWRLWREKEWTYLLLLLCWPEINFYLSKTERIDSSEQWVRKTCIPPPPRVIFVIRQPLSGAFIITLTLFQLIYQNKCRLRLPSSY